MNQHPWSPDKSMSWLELYTASPGLACASQISSTNSLSMMWSWSLGSAAMASSMYLTLDACTCSEEVSAADAQDGVKVTLFMLQIVIAGNGIAAIDLGVDSKDTKTGLSTQWNMICKSNIYFAIWPMPYP